MESLVIDLVLWLANILVAFRGKPTCWPSSVESLVIGLGKPSYWPSFVESLVICLVSWKD